MTAKANTRSLLLTCLALCASLTQATQATPSARGTGAASGNPTPTSSTSRLEVGPDYDATLRPGAVHVLSVSAGEPDNPELPQQLEIQWRSHLPGGLSRPLTATGEGHLLAPSMSGHLFELDLRGRPLWSAPLRTEVAAPAAVLRGGMRVVLTHDGVLRGFNRGGGLEYRRRLELETPEGEAWLEPAGDGSLVVAQGRDLLWVEADGALRAKTRIAARVISIAWTPNGVAILQHTGTALWWSGDSRPSVLTRLENPLAVHPGPGFVLLASEQRISRYDRRQRELAQWHHSSKFHFASAPVPIGADQVAIRSRDNALLVLSAQNEVQRFVLGPASASPHPALPPIAGSDGTVATLADDGRVIVVSLARGELVAQPSPLCAQPRSLTSVADGRLVLACAAGTLFGLGS